MKSAVHVGILLWQTVKTMDFQDLLAFKKNTNPIFCRPNPEMESLS